MKDVGETTPRTDGWVDICRYKDRRAENSVGGGGSDEVVACGCWAASDGAEGVEGGGLEVAGVAGGGAGWGNSSRKGSGVMHTRSRNGWQK
jgi:hypothetical protein